MKKILVKYNDNKYTLKHGDIILYHGTGLLAKAIQWTDKCYYNHIGIIIKLGGKLFTLDMWYSGILNGKLVICPLSERIKDFEEFCILRPKFTSSEIERSVNIALDYLDYGVEYDRLKLIKVLFKKKLGITIKKEKEKKFICSEFVQKYTNSLDNKTYSKLKDITPSDFLRYIDNNYTIMLHNNQ
jgi:hypothetical protein